MWDEEYEKLLAETGDREEAAYPEEHRWDAMRQQSAQISGI